MKSLQAKIEELVSMVNGRDAQYIMVEVEDKIRTAERFEAKGRTDIVNNIIEDIEKIALDFDSKFFTPANVQVGDGATIHMYSDSHAGTVVKVTKTTITIQHDKATLDPNWKPEVVVGGFAGHCTNQDSQTYTYERNPNGKVQTFRWNAKRGLFTNKSAGLTVTKGRHEFYDYNF